MATNDSDLLTRDAKSKFREIFACIPPSPLPYLHPSRIVSQPPPTLDLNPQPYILELVNNTEAEFTGHSEADILNLLTLH